MKKFVFASIVVALFAACADNNETAQPEYREPVEFTRADMEQAGLDNEFAFALLRTLNAENPPEDIFVSPLSLSLALGMAANGAQGQTREAFETALNRSGFTVEETNGYYARMAAHLLSADEDTDMRIANSIWTRLGFDVRPTFYELNRQYFNSEIGALDFCSPQAVETINGWCSDNTEGKIDRIIERIGVDEVMFLINAVYFKGLWEKPFDPAQTYQGSFTTLSGAVREVSYMSQTAMFDYFANGTVRCARFPYGNGSFDMMVVMPENGTVNDLIAGLDPSDWNGWLKSMRNTELVVAMPRLKMECLYSLNDALASMGLGVAFSDMADFGGINPDERLRISQVKQKTYVDIDEKGTEAAAVTVVGVGVTSVPDITAFIMNRPFLLAITERTTGVILFIGAWGK
jgi:serpin B